MTTSNHLHSAAGKLARRMAPGVEAAPLYRFSGTTSPIRESWRWLPNFIQPWLTGMSGKPSAGETPRSGSSARELFAATVAMLLGAALSGWAAATGGWVLALLPVGWVMAVHGLRKCDLGPFHEAAHAVFSKNREINDAVGTILGVVHFGQNFKSYGPSHREDHHSKSFATLKDPTFDFLINRLLLRVGMSRRRAWFRLFASLVSPRFHLEMIGDRLLASCRNASFVHWVLLVNYAQVLAAAVLLFGWVPVLVGWVLPITVFYNLAATVRMTVEHSFPQAESPGHSRREILAGCTHGIHFGSMAPDVDLPRPQRMLALAAWAARMIAWEWPARLLICPGEAVAHDAHHRKPKDEQWADYINSRQEDISSGHPPWGLPYTEVWGLIDAMDECFRTLNLADPAAFNPERG